MKAKAKRFPKSARWMAYSVEKVSEGGMGSATLVAIAKGHGAIRVKPRASVFVGHTAADVLAIPSVHRRIEREVF